MKKTIKKVTKVVKKAAKKVVDKVVDLSPLKDKCPACQGSGLWRPDFTNSPQCETCKGHGVI